MSSAIMMTSTLRLVEGRIFGVVKDALQSIFVEQGAPRSSWLSHSAISAQAELLNGAGDCVSIAHVDCVAGARAVCTPHRSTWRAGPSWSASSGTQRSDGQ